MQEIWKSIEGFEGLYEVSNLGNVRSLPRTVKNRYFPGKNRSLTSQKTGYKAVTLTGKGKRITDYVHRLVAKAFIANPENKPAINHIDSDRTNNNVMNLEWCTFQENIDHAAKVGSFNNVGEHHPQSILTEKDVKEIRNRYKKHCRKNGSGALSKEYGVSVSNIMDVIYKKSWKEVI
jgi:hypothetical protein